MFRARCCWRVHTLRRLFEADDLLTFLRALLPNESLHRYSDARGSLNYTVMAEGDELGWHFDACELVASILLRPAEVGGAFEYIPGVRTVDDERFPDVASILTGRDQHRTPVNFLPGDMVLFRGPPQSAPRDLHKRGSFAINRTDEF